MAYTPSSAYVFPIIAFHVSLLIGSLTYVIRRGDPNRLAGLRTPRTLSDKDAWAKAHDEMGRIVPAISAVCMAVSIVAFFVPAMRSPVTFFTIVGLQIAVLLGLAIKWW